MFIRTARIFIVLSLTLLIPGVMAFSQIAYQPVTLENGRSGGIDYGKRVIVVKGMGLPGGIGGRGGQIRAAIMDAQRNFLEVTKGALITSETTVEGLITTSDIIQSRVEGVVKNFTAVDTSYWDDGTIEVTVEFNMGGEFLDAVLPPTMGGGTPPSYSGAAPSGRTFTGLIVDARGLGVRPALAPKIIDSDGNEVYGSSMVSREYAIQQGMVGYAKDPAKASENDRVAPNPLLVKGIKVEGPNKTDVVISNQNAAELTAMSENLNFLRQCKVMILVD